MKLTIEIAEENLPEFLNYLKRVSFVKNIAIKDGVLTPEQYEIWKEIKAGLEDARQGRLISASTFLDELKKA